MIDNSFPADAVQAASAGAASDSELLAIVRSEPRDSARRAAAVQSLVARYQWLVTACVRRYRGGPELAEDLMQVGYVGLLKAISSFDPERGNDLAAYARPSVSGEIKRHFRDKRWQVHVARPLQELRLEMNSAISELTQELQRTPGDTDIARFLDVSPGQLAEVRGADLTFRPASLDAPVGGDASDEPRELADVIGAVDRRLEQVIEMEAVAVHWPQLPAAEQRVLLLRFYGNMTQEEIAKRLGVSQMQISRLQKRALRRLRALIEGAEADGDAPGPAKGA
jgi:RNA polymerase sigma-B factor